MVARGRARRWAGRAAAIGAAGLATTLAVAWACALRAPALAGRRATRVSERMTDPAGVEVARPVDGRAPAGTMYFELNLYDGAGATFGTSRLRPFQNYTPTGAPPPPKPPTPESVARRWERAVLLPWLDGGRPWPDPAKGDRVWAVASGWPLRVVACTLRATNAPNFATHRWEARGGLVLSGRVRQGWADWPPMLPVVAPLTPLWPELLASTVLYGGLWAVVGAAAAGVMRWRRGAAGSCPRCGYDLVGDLASGCPECGWGRTAAGV